MAAAAGTKPTKSRQRKIECPECGCILYGSAAALAVGLPTCSCGSTFEIPNMRDLAAIDPVAFEAARTALPEGSHNSLMRELGFNQAVYTTNKRTMPRQCTKRGCKAFRASALERYCAEHLDLEQVPF